MDTYEHKITGMVVEAIQIGPETIDRASNWAGGAQIVEEIHPMSRERTEGLNVKTPSGTQRASRGAYVVGVNGRFFVVGKEGFEASYSPEEVKDQPASRAPDEPYSPTDDPFEGMTRFNEGPKP